MFSFMAVTAVYVLRILHESHLMAGVSSCHFRTDKAPREALLSFDLHNVKLKHKYFRFVRPSTGLLRSTLSVRGILLVYTTS